MPARKNARDSSASPPSSCRPASGRSCGSTCSAAACCCGWGCAPWRRCSCGRSRAAGIRRSATALGDVVRRDLVARVDFKQPDPDATEQSSRRARRETPSPSTTRIPSRWSNSAAKLRTEIGNLLAAETLAEVDPAAWKQVPAHAGRRHARPDARGARGAVPAIPRSVRRRERAGRRSASNWPRRWRRSSSRACSKTCRRSTTTEPTRRRFGSARRSAERVGAQAP